MPSISSARKNGKEKEGKIIGKFDGGYVMYTAGREQPYTIWYEGYVEKFTETFKEVQAYCIRKGYVI